MALRNWLIVAAILLTSSALWSQTPQPPPPDLLSVSVDPATNATTINWRERLDPSFPIVKYIINELEYPRIQPQPKFDPIDSVNAPITTYTNPSTAITKADLSTQAFSVTARSSVPGSNVSILYDAHYTSFLLPADIDSCAMKASLKWRRYKSVNADDLREQGRHQAFNQAIQYEVWGYQSNAAFSQPLATQLSGRISDTTYTTNALTVGVNYYFFIKVFLPNNEVSTTNRISAKVTGSALPLAIHMTRVDATGPGVALNFNFSDNPDADPSLYSCIIERSVNPGSGFSKIYQFYGKPNSYTDNSADPTKVSYYRITALKCERPIVTSDTINTILLTTSMQGENDVSLSWAPLNGQSATYDIDRVQPDNTTIATLQPTTSYTYDISVLVQQGYNTFCHRVTGHSLAQTSISGVQCTTMTPQVFMPNAIDPTSSVINATTGRKRNEFGPAVNMPDISYGYTLVIFNRWNIKIFEANKNIGTALKTADVWDGTYKGKLVDPGVYMYTIVVRFNNTQTSLKGTVTVVY